MIRWRSCSDAFSSMKKKYRYKEWASWGNMSDTAVRSGLLDAYVGVLIPTSSTSSCIRLWRPSIWDFFLSLVFRAWTRLRSRLSSSKWSVDISVDAFHVWSNSAVSVDSRVCNIPSRQPFFLSHFLSFIYMGALFDREVIVGGVGVVEAWNVVTHIICPPGSVFTFRTDHATRNWLKWRL